MPNKIPEYRRAGRYKGGKYAYSLNEKRELVAVNVPADIREKLEALGWLKGGLGQYAFIARELLRRGVEDMIGELNPKERELFENRILPNVKINREIFRKERRERVRDINALLRSEDETKYPDLPELTEDDEIPAP